MSKKSRKKKRRSRRRNRHRNHHNGRSRNRGGGAGRGARSEGSRGGGGRTAPEKFGGREPRRAGPRPRPSGPLELTPFELFCTYHLGITEDHGYRKPRSREIARRFDVSLDELHAALRRLRLDRNAIDDADFDISLARLDIRVAPEGIDRRELARGLYDELLERNPELVDLHAEHDRARA